MINNITIVGRLTADPELKKTTNDVAFCSFCIANDTGFGERKQTNFIPCSSWKQQAETLCKFMHKGSLVGVVGKLTSRKYTDKEGKNHIAYEIVTDEIQFLESKKDGAVNQPTDEIESKGDLPF